VATRTRASMSLRAPLASSRRPQLPVCVPRAPAPRPVRAPHAGLERSVLRRVPPARFCGPPEPAPPPQPAEARRSRRSPRGRGRPVARSAVLAAVPRNPRRVARAVARRRLRAWGTHPQQPRARAPRPDRARHAAGPGGRCGGRGTQGNLERALAFVLLLYLRSERERERPLLLPAPHAPPHVTCAPRLLHQKGLQRFRDARRNRPQESVGAAASSGEARPGIAPALCWSAGRGGGRACWRDETCPVSTGGGTRRVQSVREGGGGGVAGLPRTRGGARRRSAGACARSAPRDATRAAPRATLPPPEAGCPSGHGRAVRDARARRVRPASPGQRWPQRAAGSRVHGAQRGRGRRQVLLGVVDLPPRVRPPSGIRYLPVGIAKLIFPHPLHGRASRA